MNHFYSIVQQVMVIDSNYQSNSVIFVAEQNTEPACIVSYSHTVAGQHLYIISTNPEQLPLN